MLHWLNFTLFLITGTPLLLVDCLLFFTGTSCYTFCLPLGFDYRNTMLHWLNFTLFLLQEHHVTLVYFSPVLFA